MSEILPLSAAAGTSNTVRALAIRLAEDLRAQLDVIAALNERSVTEEIRVALEAWVERSKNDASLASRADAVRAGIEREAQAKRDAIGAIFGSAVVKESRASKRSESS